ncbi:MAG: SigE family RNA polymerase sigma factor [Mycobacteriales bacterium]
MRATQRDEFTTYVRERSTALRRTAFLLCGDWHRAEDIVQTALVKLYTAWNRIRRAEAVDAYARQIIVRTFLDERRRRSASQEIPTGELPEVPDRHPGSDEKLLVLAALAEVPPRQRAVLVLRFWEDMSIEQTAHLLGCREGTVKSQTAHGLTALKAALARAGYERAAVGA